jgi:hypothetical protein
VKKVAGLTPFYGTSFGGCTVLPDSGVHRYFSQHFRKIILNSGYIFKEIPVPLSILSKVAEK